MNEYLKLFQDGADKQLIITCGDTTITNEDIFYESMNVAESICSENQLTFGCCEAGMFKIKIANMFSSMKDKKISVSMSIDGHMPFNIGKYKVYDDKVTADKMWREIKAYDSLYEITASDVAAWYNKILPDENSEVTLKSFRDSFFEYLGIEQEDAALVNDNMIIRKTIHIAAGEETDTTSVMGEPLSGGEVLRCICEINGCFGHMNREDKFCYISLNKNNLVKIPQGDYIDCNYEDYISNQISKLQIRQEENDIGVTVGDGENCYIIQGNFLVYDKSSDELQEIGQNVFNKIHNISFLPFSVTRQGNFCYEVGDPIEIVTEHKKIESYILKRSIKGIQSLIDNYSAKGVEIYKEQINSTKQEISKIKGKANILERTIEQTRLDMIDMQKGLETEIKITTEGISSMATKAMQDAENAVGTASDATSQVEAIQSTVEQQAEQLLATVKKGESYNGVVIDTGGIHANGDGSFTIDMNNVKLNKNGIMELLSAYISDKIKMRALGNTIPPSYTDYVDAIYANTGSVASKSVDWTTWGSASSEIYGVLLLNVGSSEVPLKILSNTEFKESILCDNEVYVDSDLFATRIGCNSLKIAGYEAVTAKNIGKQSVKYATTAGSAPANGGNASTVGGYSADGLKIKFYNIGLSNVACTTKSARGAYYSGVLDTVSNHGITQDKIIGITITNWGGAVASFTPYYQAGVIRIMSDVSQTITRIDMKVAYITY